MSTPAQREAVAEKLWDLSVRDPETKVAAMKFGDLSPSTKQRLRREADEVIAAYEATAWQPIETAPKQKILQLFAYTGSIGAEPNWKMAAGVKDHEGSWIWDGRALKPYDWQPTHWRPLPAPPKDPAP